MREGHHRRRPVLPHHQGHPRRRHRDGRDRAPDRGRRAPAHLHGPDQLFAVPDAHAFAADVVLADVIPLPIAHDLDATDHATTAPAPGTITGLTSSEALS